MSYLDARKPWCTQRLCQLSQAHLTQVLQGLEQYGFPTAGEIENSAYCQADREKTYINLVAKAIFCILELKKNIHTIDKEALMRVVEELKFGKKQETQDVLPYVRSKYEGKGLYDRRKYGEKSGKQALKQVEITRKHIAAATIFDKTEHRVSFEMDKEVKQEDDLGSTASSSSHGSELAQLEEAITQIKSKDFNAQALIEKLKSRYSTDAKLSHKVKVKVQCLLELLEDFDCYDELLEK